MYQTAQHFTYKIKIATEGEWIYNEQMGAALA
jgi:hypothetical protein